MPQFTRPDISIVVTKICQFVQNSTEYHWAVVKRILWYFKHIVNHGLLNTAQMHFIFKCIPMLIGLDVLMIIIRQVAIVSFLMVTWSHGVHENKKTVLRSSMKVEYPILATATTEIMWIQTLVREFGYPIWSYFMAWQLRCYISHGESRVPCVN